MSSHDSRRIKRLIAGAMAAVSLSIAPVVLVAFTVTLQPATIHVITDYPYVGPP